MVLALVLLSGAIGALMFAKVTRWYELLILGGWGVLLGAALAGKSSFDSLSVAALWNVIF